jgi:hypothetical protein
MRLLLVEDDKKAHWALTRLVLGQVDTALVSLAETEAAALQANPRPIGVHEFAPGTGPPSFRRLDRFVQIVSLDGEVLAWSANLGTARLPVSPVMLGRLRAGEVAFQTLDHFGEEPIRVVALPLTAGNTPVGVLVAGSLDDAYSVLAAGRWLFLGLTLLLVAAVALTSVLFARRALRPISEIVAQARRIGETGLGERLPHLRSHDELGRLIDTLNDMLARIERSMDTQRRFTADASHELRSPLSRLRAELEATLRRPRESADYRETLRSCLEEVERLSRSPKSCSRSHIRSSGLDAWDLSSPEGVAYRGRQSAARRALAADRTELAGTSQCGTRAMYPGPALLQGGPDPALVSSPNGRSRRSAVSGRRVDEGQPRRQARRLAARGCRRRADPRGIAWGRRGKGRDHGRCRNPLAARMSTPGRDGGGTEQPVAIGSGGPSARGRSACIFEP